MAASMKGQPPELKNYLRTNKLPDVYEASFPPLPGSPPASLIVYKIDIGYSNQHFPLAIKFIVSSIRFRYLNEIYLFF